MDLCVHQAAGTVELHGEGGLLASSQGFLLQESKDIRHTSKHISQRTRRPWCYLKAGDGEAASVVRQRGHRDHEGRVRDVLVIEFDGDFIVT